MRRLSFLLSLNAQCTMMAPADGVYETLKSLDAKHDCVLSFAMGFPAADIAECGPVVWGYGDEAEAAVQASQFLAAVALRSSQGDPDAARAMHIVDRDDPGED